MFRLMPIAVIVLVLILVVAAPAQQFGAPIQDNSFLIEEAYNQERGVIQHISSFTRLWASRDWTYTFTEEWPVPGHQRHQLSTTFAAVSPGAFASGAGLGDSLLNYRYQLVGSGETRYAIAPRLSLIIPTGGARMGRGFGGMGMQLNLPASIVLNRHFVTHWNAGTTIIPSAADSAGDRARISGYNLGQSVVWLARPRFNVLCETSWATMQSVTGPGRVDRVRTLFLNPGIRWAHNFGSGLQIVPGIAVPIGVGPSGGDRGILLYLSFEHPSRLAY